jgi:hypothetical protein
LIELGIRVPDALVWTPGDPEPVQLRTAIDGPGCSLLCFTPFDWSPT